MKISSRIFSTDNLDIKNLTANDVRFVFVTMLPFRIRTGKLYKVPVIDNEIEIWLLNKFDIPEKTDFDEIIKIESSKPPGWAFLWTHAIIIMNSPKIQKEDLDKLKNGKIEGIRFLNDHWKIINALNEFIGVYSKAANTFHGGVPLHILTNTDFFRSLWTEIALLARKEYIITEKDIMDFITCEPNFGIYIPETNQLTGYLSDLPKETIDKIPTYLKRFREHVFYELEFRANCEIISQEPITAIVLACAALEGAHAAYLRARLNSHLKPLLKESEELINNLLREQGIYTVIRLTICVFMPETLRPSESELQKCLDGIKIRNDIMHAKRTSKGYKLREYTFKNLNDACSGIFKIYDCFVKALNEIEGES